MFFATLDLVARVLVVSALVYASAVGLTHWAIRRRHISPFGAWSRLIRRAGDPILLPLERRVIVGGGSGRSKVVAIEAISPEDASRRLGL